MDTDLNSLVEQTMSEYHEYEQEKKRKAEEQKRKQEQASEQRLSQMLHECLTPEFLASAECSFRHDYSNHYNKNELTTSAFFSYLGLNWHLSFSHNWTISTVESDTPNKWRTNRASDISNDVLQARLLIEMGKHREQIERLEREQVERTQERQRQQKERREMEARAEIALQERIAEVDQEHERLLALFKEAWARVERDMWRWPEGTTIEIYRVEYAKGSYRDEEDGETSFEYGSGWTATDHLDERGRIQLEPTRSYSSSARVVQLVMDIHRPIWTVYHYSSVEELPEILRKKVTVSLPGVVERSDHSLDNKSRLVEVENLDYDEDYHEKTIGEVPLPWIRAIVESAANGE